MKHTSQIQSEFVKHAFTKQAKWEDLSYEAQKDYLKRHPKSKQKITTKPGQTGKSLNQLKDELLNKKLEFDPKKEKSNQLDEKFKNANVYTNTYGSAMSKIFKEEVKKQNPKPNQKLLQKQDLALYIALTNIRDSGKYKPIKDPKAIRSIAKSMATNNINDKSKINSLVEAKAIPLGFYNEKASKKINKMSPENQLKLIKDLKQTKSSIKDALYEIQKPIKQDTQIEPLQENDFTKLHNGIVEKSNKIINKINKTINKQNEKQITKKESKRQLKLLQSKLTNILTNIPDEILKTPGNDLFLNKKPIKNNVKIYEDISYPRTKRN